MPNHALSIHRAQALAVLWTNVPGSSPSRHRQSRYGNEDRAGNSAAGSQPQPQTRWHHLKIVPRSAHHRVTGYLPSHRRRDRRNPSVGRLGRRKDSLRGWGQVPNRTQSGVPGLATQPARPCPEGHWRRPWRAGAAQQTTTFEPAETQCGLAASGFSLLTSPFKSGAG